MCTSGAPGTLNRFSRRCQKLSCCLRQVFKFPSPASRTSRPMSLRVPDDILRCVTCARTSFFPMLLCSVAYGDPASAADQVLELSGWAAISLRMRCRFLQLKSRPQYRVMAAQAPEIFIQPSMGIEIPQKHALND